MEGIESTKTVVASLFGKINHDKEKEAAQHFIY